jgi:hypothetical protein
MFLILGDGEILDFDLQFLRELVRLLDAQLEDIEKQATHVSDVDAFGEAFEYIAGIGFVACQGYLAVTYGSLGVKKQDALKKKPGHRSGYTIAELVNHAANFWKHHEEWPLNPNSRQQAATLAALAALDIEGKDYPLSCALAALVLPTRGRFHALLSHLEAWRDALASAE